MSNSRPIGVTINEGVSSGLTPFQETSKHNIGLLMERLRGVPNIAKEVQSLQDDRKVFGGLSNEMYGAYVTRHIFKNSGSFGASVWGIRILDEENSATAMASFTDGASTPNTIFNVYAGQEGHKDPGNWANGSAGTEEGVRVRCFPKGHINGVVDKYMFQIFYNGKNVENWESDTWAGLIGLINSLSFYVYLVPEDLNLDITDIQELYLTGGVYAPPTEAMFLPVEDESEPKGFAAFNDTDVQIISCTEQFSVNMALAGRDYCSLHYNKPLYVYNLPYLSPTSLVESYADALQSGTPNFSAAYNFWVKTSNEEGSQVWVPSLGVILGAGFIRVPETNRGYIHYPPAGIESIFTDVTDIAPRSLNNATLTTWVKRFTTNVAVFRRGKGFFLYSSRTNSTNPLYHSIHVRRQTSLYAKTLEENLLWVIQKPVSPELAREAYVSILSYFRDEYGKGALERSIPFEEACIITTHTDPQDRKTLVIIVDIILTEATEAVRIELNRNDGSLITNINS